MAKLNNVYLNAGKVSGKGPKAKVERNVVAIVGEKGWSIATNGKDICNVHNVPESTVSADLEALVEVLASVPTNDTVIDHPVRIVLPKVIAGLATGAFLDYIRTGKTVSEGKDIDSAQLESYKVVMALYAERSFNVELVSDQHTNKQDKEVVDGAWKALKAEIAKLVRGTGSALAGAVQQAPVVSGLSAEDEAKIAELKAEINALEDELDDADDEEVEAKLQRKIDKKMARIARIKAMAGQEEVKEEQKPEQKPADNSEFASAF